MNTRQKGRAFVKKVIERLKEIDSGTYEIVGSGAGKEKGDLRAPLFDMVGEGKDQKQLAMREWTRQSEKEGLGYNKTFLAWRHPDSPSANPDIRIDISIEFFIELLKKSKEPKTAERQLQSGEKWKIQRLVQSAKEVMKLYDP